MEHASGRIQVAPGTRFTVGKPFMGVDASYSTNSTKSVRTPLQTGGVLSTGDLCFVDDVYGYEKRVYRRHPSTVKPVCQVPCGYTEHCAQHF
jgi:hypothetical protein